MSFSKFFAPTSRSSISLYLGLRLLQVGACAIAGFIFCYLIWQHNNHYCNFYSCNGWQQRETIVPTVYIWLTTTLIAAFISAFVLSFRQLSFFVDSIESIDPATGFPTRPVRLPIVEPEEVDKDENYDGPPMPITIWLKQLPSSVPQLALLVDVSILTVFFLSWQEYSQTMILGPVIPYCRLWRGCNAKTGDGYWQNLRVIDKECIISQCSWTTSIFVMAFTFLIVVLEAYYVRKEYEEKRDAARIDDTFESGAPPEEKIVLTTKT